MFNSKKKIVSAAFLLAVNLSAYAQEENTVDLNGIWNDDEIKIVQIFL